MGRGRNCTAAARGGVRRGPHMLGAAADIGAAAGRFTGDATEEPRPCRVLQAFHNPPNIIWEIRIDAAIIGQTDVVKTTAGHPFSVKLKGHARWRQAQESRGACCGALAQ